MIAAPTDFAGINHYQRVDRPARRRRRARCGCASAPAEPATTSFGWSVIPESLHSRAHPRLARVHVAADLRHRERRELHDYVDPDGDVVDLERVDYLRGYLDAAARDAVNGRRRARLLRVVVPRQLRVGRGLRQAVRPGLRRLRTPSVASRSSAPTGTSGSSASGCRSSSRSARRAEPGRAPCSPSHHPHITLEQRKRYLNEELRQGRTRGRDGRGRRARRQRMHVRRRAGRRRRPAHRLDHGRLGHELRAARRAVGRGVRHRGRGRRHARGTASTSGSPPPSHPASGPDVLQVGLSQAAHLRRRRSAARPRRPARRAPGPRGRELRGGHRRRGVGRRRRDRRACRGSATRECCSPAPTSSPRTASTRRRPPGSSCAPTPRPSPPAARDSTATTSRSGTARCRSS